MIKFSKTLFFLFAFTLLVFQNGAFAAETAKLSVFPASFEKEDPRTRSWFIWTVKPGETRGDEVVVQNKNNEPVELEIYSVDATANKDGAFTLFPKGEKNSAGGWISLSKSSLLVPPQAKVSVPFTVKIPLTAGPGDHVAGIAVETKSGEEPSSSGVRLVQRIGVRFYLTVEGEKTENLEISDLRVVSDAGESYLSYVLANKGNTNLALSGLIRLRSILGSATVNLESLGEILAGKELSGKIKLADVNPLSFLASFNLKYGEDKELARSVFFVSPIAAAVLVLIPVGAVLFIVLKRKRTK
ncbi:MAG: DUF916 domain-containing protein [bacterium]|nr:DUF916 domain-containing protein [bacterium]